MTIRMLIFVILDNLILMLISDNLCDHLRDVPWEGIFKLGASAAASEFHEWIQVGTDVYTPSL